MALWSWPGAVLIAGLVATGCSFQPDEVAPDGSSASDGSVGGDGSTDGSATGEDAPVDAVPPDAPIDACVALPGELCNGVDDDCDGDADEDLGLGVGCDGLDGDFCAEGTQVCDGAGGVTCNDVTGDAVESCNGADDDCDGGTDEDFDLQGSEDTCGNCTTMCVNPNGTTSCVTGTCTPVCTELAGDCDGNAPNGCELARDTNPVCTSRTVLGSVSGDVGITTLTATGLRERWFLFQVTENDTDDFEALTARVELQSPPGVNFDLYVYCYTCGGTLMGSSTNGQGQLDAVDVQRDDVSGFTTYNVLVELRGVSGGNCASWGLTVTGNTTVGTATCL